MRVLVLLAILLAVPPFVRAQGTEAPLAPELTGFGALDFGVTTGVPRAQRGRPNGCEWR